MLIENILALNDDAVDNFEPYVPGDTFVSSAPDQLKRSIVEHIGQSDFPCVGAKSALAGGGLTIFAAGAITAAGDDLRIYDALLRLGTGEDSEIQGFRSLAVIFAGPQGLDEPSFETALWRRLSTLLAEDRRRGYAYAPGFSDNPDDAHFALSFGGQAFFAVGLHPQASRTARCLPFPAIMFNPHDQFERLRAEQKYERMREVILTRDAELDGEANPMIARHGDISEARQYSGRAVGSDWTCPLALRGAK
jgi:uncharacterized protein